jgi:hypothetical protein
MRVINVIEVVDNTVTKIQSFGVFEEQHSQEVVEKAEEYFINLVEEYEGALLSDDEKKLYLNDGYYENNGYDKYYLCIVWSEI